MTLEATLKSVLSGARVEAELYFDEVGLDNYNDTGLYKGSYKGFCKSSYFENAKKATKELNRTLFCKDSNLAYRLYVPLDNAKKVFCAAQSSKTPDVSSVVTSGKISKSSLKCPKADGS